MIKVTVTSTEVREQSGIGKASGKPYTLHFQMVWLHTYDRSGNPNPFPEKVEIILDKNKDGVPVFYPVGDYTLAPESIYVSRTGDPALSIKLKPLKKPPVAATV